MVFYIQKLLANYCKSTELLLLSISALSLYIRNFILVNPRLWKKIAFLHDRFYTENTNKTSILNDIFSISYSAYKNASINPSLIWKLRFLSTKVYQIIFINKNFENVNNALLKKNSFFLFINGILLSVYSFKNTYIWYLKFIDICTALSIFNVFCDLKHCK